MDLVRQILLKAITEPHAYTNGNPSIEEFSDEQVGYHVWLMEQQMAKSGTKLGKGGMPTYPTHAPV